MAYIVIELQTSSQGQSSNIVTAYDSLAQAESKYHTILAAAAVSSVPHHAAVILDHTGMQLAQRCFEHDGVVEGA